MQAKKIKSILNLAAATLTKTFFLGKNLSCRFYPLKDNWMIVTGKELPDILLKIKLNIYKLTHKCSIIRENIEELLCAYYFNNIENLIDSIISKEFHWHMQAYDYCQDLVVETEEISETLLYFDNNRKKLLEYT